MIKGDYKIKDKWLQIKQNLQKNWGKLTNDELDKTNGDVKTISGLIQQKYGQTHDNYSQKLSEIFSILEQKKDKKNTDIKNKFKK